MTATATVTESVNGANVVFGVVCAWVFTLYSSLRGNFMKILLPTDAENNLLSFVSTSHTSQMCARTTCVWVFYCYWYFGGVAVIVGTVAPCNIIVNILWSIQYYIQNWKYLVLF